MTNRARTYCCMLLLLAGCQSLRPQLPEPRPQPRHPFPEDQRDTPDKTPAIQKTAFAPPEMPKEPFERPQPLPAPLYAVQPTELQVATPEPKREPLAEAVQAIFEDRHDEALRHLQAYDPETQDWFLRLLPTLSLLSKKRIQELDATEVRALQEQLFGLLAALRPKTELAISKACFCEWIKSYGDYKPLPEGYAFAAASASRPGECVQLYVELQNFMRELRNGQYETRLASSVEIRDSKGETMWSYRFEDGKQALRTRTPRNDYYNSYSFHVPRSIPPGVYTLVVQIADETSPGSRRVAQKTMEFRVAATPLRAAR